MTKLITSVTRGTDPELFLRDKKSKKFISAIGKIGGTKEDPRPIKNGIFVQEDNVLAEFNTPPTKTFASFKQAVKNGIAAIDELSGTKLEVAIEPYAFFEEDQLKHPKAQEAGCTPDYNCWSLAQNESPCLSHNTLRTASGHLHIGYERPDMKISQQIGMAMDLFAAVPSVLMSDETPRRELYGKMGAVRFRGYGIEYRTLSNFWLKSDEKIEWAYDTITKAVEFVNNKQTVSPQMKVIMKLAINEGNTKAAQYLVDQHKLALAV